MKSRFKRWRIKKHTKPLSSKTSASTIPLADKQVKGMFDRVYFEPIQLVSYSGRSIGKQRDHNEDSLFALSLTIGSHTRSQPLGIYIIADGMGGYQFGEVASGTAVRVLSTYILEKLYPYLIDPSKPMEESMQDVMRSAINEAQHAVTQSAPGGGTTLTAALVLGRQMTIAHVGDSRAYALRPDGRAESLTRDHSLVRRLEELGQISAEEAVAHPQRNVLYRALGQGESLESDVFTIPFPQPGFLLLCSDGLWSVVPDDNIYRIVMSTPNMQTACQNLLAAANEAGGPDNISVVLVQLLGQEK